METDFGELYKANHRRQQWMLAAAAGIVMICGLAPRNERALFFTELPRTVRALSVAVPPVGYTVIGEDGPVAAFRNYLARPRGGRSTAAAPDVFVLPPATPFAMADDGLTIPFAGVPGFRPVSFEPLAPPLFAGEPGSPAPVGESSTGSSGGSSTGGTSTGGTSTGGTSSGDPTTSTGGPTTSSGGPTTSTGGPSTSSGDPTTSTGGPTTSTGGPTTSSGDPTTSTGGPPPPPPNTPVAPVPEPLTWMMMIFGFFAMGGVLRQRPRSVQA